MKNKGRNVVWSIAMDKCLIEALAIQAKNRNKIDKCFNENAYTAACIAVNSRFNLNLNNQKVINRLKTIKKRYKVMRDMLSQDGFWWNPNTKMIECDSEDLWTRCIAVSMFGAIFLNFFLSFSIYFFILLDMYGLSYEYIEQAHPDAKGFRGKQIEMYDELKIVCGNYQAPSRWAKMKDGSHPTGYKNFEEDSASFVSPSSNDISDTDGTKSYSGQPEYLHEGSQDPPVTEPPRQLPKRPHEADALQEATLAVASSIRRLADAMDRTKATINPSELLQAVMEINGLEEAKQMYAFEYLNADPIKARAFLAYNVRMRKTYLFRQFWWWK
ncbi:hypothetical protein V6N12_041274 [Hibiscus sabdariffa]|uniref:Myb/SANT-like domain-containing protein n=1 Tax=Hibiscus sabdariffa TaxID=183260 RepID=A0ABR2E6A4_9ROSI